MKPEIKRFFQNKTKMVVVLVAISCLGVTYWAVSTETGTGQVASSAQSDCDMTEADQPADATANQGGMLYICPMNCVPPVAKAGRCPVCGMDLVAAATDREQDHQENASFVSISPQKIRTAGIQVAPVERKFVTKEIRLFGKIEYDPVEQYKVTAFAPGVIDKIYVKRAGQQVRKGDPLFDMHSSELFFLEEEFFEALKKSGYEIITGVSRGHGNMKVGRWHKALLHTKKPDKDADMNEEEAEETREARQRLERIRSRLRLFGLTNKEINALIVRGRPTGISTVTTPTSGIVLEQNAFKGAYVNTGETIFTVAKPRYMWARLEGYASDFPWIKLRQDAEFQVYSYPGQTFKGKVLYLDPEFDPKTRTFKVGVLYTDTKARLKPNMLVRCGIHARMTADGVGLPDKKAAEKAPLVIPDSAPLITGTRALVYVEVPGKPGTYETREVVLGPRAKDYSVVKHGLKEGEMVVVNGSFKIDSAVQILAKPSMMEPRRGSMTAGHHQHGQSPGMEMDIQMKPAPKSKPSRRGLRQAKHAAHQSNE
jgi:Cu(I)/Ag(I) efflux system membrane fusion protein